MILKIDTRLGSEVNFLSTEGGKVNSVNSCTATDGNNSFSIYQISAIKT